MRVVFLNIDKKEIVNIKSNIKYVLISENPKNVSKYLGIDIKPIVILYNGAYVIDLEKNSVIINKPIDEKSYNDIYKYATTHNVNIIPFKKNDNVYEIKLSCDNYHRRVIIPYLFEDKIPKVTTIKRNKSLCVTSRDVSLISSIEEVLSYLKLNTNYIDLENIYINVSIEGYYKDKLNWKGFELYES